VEFFTFRLVTSGVQRSIGLERVLYSLNSINITDRYVFVSVYRMVIRNAIVFPVIQFIVHRVVKV